MFRINFGDKIIDECPNSYCDWEYVGDAMYANRCYEAGFLPEVWDTQRGHQASILDQTEFFHSMSQLVQVVKNKAEAKAYEKTKSKG